MNNVLEREDDINENFTCGHRMTWGTHLQELTGI